jgi:hypothetical protein
MKKSTPSIRITNQTPSSQGRIQTKQDEGLVLIGKIKSELSSRIVALQKFKATAINTVNCSIEAGAKSRLRIQIENYLIELNEEIFNISNELAKAYGSGSAPSKNQMLKKGREFELRKNMLIKKIQKGISESVPPKIAALYTTGRPSSRSGSRSTSPAFMGRQGTIKRGNSKVSTIPPRNHRKLSRSPKSSPMQPLQSIEDEKGNT